jgi:anti-sigma regulatory factor (Ser/Thr protein kinase)
MTGAALLGERAAQARASFSVGGGPGVAADARRAIYPLRARLGDRLAEDLELLVSELVTNSFRHSGAPDAIAVELTVEPECVRCEVVDGGRGFPAAPVPPGRRGDGGWGLHIVDQLADHWGVRRGPPTAVWFEISR